MKKLITLLTAAAVISCTACTSGNSSSGTPAAQESSISQIAFREADITLADSFSAVTALDRNKASVLIFGELKNGSYAARISGYDFADHSEIRFTPQENETVMNAAITQNGKTLILTCNESGDECETMLYIYAYDGSPEKTLSLGDILYSSGITANIVPAEDGYIVCVNNESLAVFDTDGRYRGDVRLRDNVLCSIFRDNDGVPTALLRNNSGELCTAAISGTELGDIRRTGRDSTPYWICAGQGDYAAAGIFGDGLWVLPADEGGWQRLSELSDNTFSIYSLGGIVMTAEDELALVEYTADGCDMLLLTQRDISQVSSKTVVRVATTIGNDFDLQDYVKKYNNQHIDDNYRMEIVSYGGTQDETHDEAQERLRMDIISGNAPDIVAFSPETPVISFGSRESEFVDLYTLIDSDPDLSREDFIPRVLEGLESGGKLLTITPVFMIDTVAARDGIVPTVHENWSVEDNKQAILDLPEGWEMMWMPVPMLRSDYFFSLLDMAHFVDIENAECSFDLPEFAELLQFVGDNKLGMTAKEFKSTYTGSETISFGAYDRALDMRNGKYLLVSGIRTFGDIFTAVRGQFDGDAVFVGEPTYDGNGTTLNVNSFQKGIMANSEHIAQAWDFLSSMLTEEYYDSYVNGAFEPVIEEYFDKRADSYKSGNLHMDVRAGEETDEWRYYYSDTEYIVMPPFTEEECEYWKSFVKNSKVASVDYQVIDMVREETERYFEGECTAEQCAEILQDRVSTYLSERYG
ncbi:MAG: hypothetical protein IJ874_02720 [Ruminococcus sp.]|nr:hypothetical protein [Ruminococcus sp.]